MSSYSEQVLIILPEKFEKGVRIQVAGFRNSDFHDALVNPDLYNNYERCEQRTENSYF